MPALGERACDIPVLVQHKLAQLGGHSPSRTMSFSPAAMEQLMAAPWPGNVRQLFNVVEHCVAMSPSPLIGPHLVEDALEEWTYEGGEQRPAGKVESLEEARESFMRNYLVKLLQLTNGNVSRAARMAKRNRTDFYKLLNRHHIDWSRYKAS